MHRRSETAAGPHDDSMLMIPPPGFKFIPRFETACGKPGCFECFDIYCERCESKDRRIIELEMRNNDLAKYITQLQAKVFGPARPAAAAAAAAAAAPVPQQQQQQQQQGLQPGLQQQLLQQQAEHAAKAYPHPERTPGEPFAYIQSPVLFDPTLNLSYVATTSFSPVPQ